MKQGEYAHAKSLYDEGLTWARQEGHLELLCRMLSNLGHTLRLEGDYPQAERWLREGLALARQLTYQREQISLLLNLGVVVCQQGAIVQGAVLFVEGLALARQSGEHRKIKQFLINLGAVAVEQQDYGQAERYLQEGLVEARQTGDTISCIVLLTNLGTILAKRGRRQEAQTAFEEGVQFARKQGDPWLLSNALGRRADASLLADHVKEAKQGFEASLAVYQDREPNRELATMARFGLAQVMARCGKQEEAEQCLQTFVEMHHVVPRRCIHGSPSFRNRWSKKRRLWSISRRWRALCRCKWVNAARHVVRLRLPNGEREPRADNATSVEFVVGPLQHHQMQQFSRSDGQSRATWWCKERVCEP